MLKSSAGLQSSASSPSLESFGFRDRGILLHYQPRGENWTVTRQMAELSLRSLGVSSPSVNLYKQDLPHWGSARQLRQAGEWPGVYISQGMERKVGKKGKPQ